MKDEIDYSEIYGLRTLVFVEVEPQSNKYHQVLLSPEMYKDLTGSISKVSSTFKLGRNETTDRFVPIEERELKTSEEEYTLPDLPCAVSNYNEI